MVQVHVSAMSTVRTSPPWKRRSMKAEPAAGERLRGEIDAGRDHPEANVHTPVEWDQARAYILRRLGDRRAAAYGRDVLNAMEPHVSRMWQHVRTNQDLVSNLLEFQNMVNSLDLGLVVVRPDAAISYINDRAMEILKLRSQSGVECVLPPAIRTWVQNAIAAVAAEGGQMQDTLQTMSGRLTLQLRALLGGERYMLQAAPVRDPADAGHLAALGLSPRQAQVMGHILRGRATVEIAAELHLSRRTVEKHVENILEILGVTSRSAAIVKIMGLQGQGNVGSGT